MPVVYVTADVAGAIESPVYAILALSPQIEAMPLREGYALDQHTAAQPFRGDRFAMKWDGEWHITYEVFRDLGIAFAAVLVLIYVLNVAWFQSFKTPLVIMSAIPFSLVGILPAHGLFGAFFTATSMIGFIAGAGIVVRNSIILVDFIEQRIGEGVAARTGGGRCRRGAVPADGADRRGGRGRRVHHPVRPDLPGPRDLADGRRGRLAAAVADDRPGRVFPDEAPGAPPPEPFVCRLAPTPMTGLRKDLTYGYDEALARLPAALKQEGFGVLTEIDIAATLKQKLGVEFRRYKILGACNPTFAHQALGMRLEIGVMLPCNVVVYENDQGKATVLAIDPMQTMAAADPALAPVAQEVGGRLARVLETL